MLLWQKNALPSQGAKNKKNKTRKIILSSVVNHSQMQMQRQKD
jgi:hypothetical protein